MAFAIVFETYAKIAISPIPEKGEKINDNKITFLLMFSLIMGGMALFRVIFCLGHLLKWKLRRCCYPEYKVYKFDMQHEFEEMRAKAKNWDESLLDQTGLDLLGNDMGQESEFDKQERNKDQDLVEESFVHMPKYRSNVSKKRSKRGPGLSAKLDRTWVDQDDDDEEFDNAVKEEQEDMTQNDISAFMVSNKELKSFMLDQSRRHDGGLVKLYGSSNLDAIEENNDEEPLLSEMYAPKPKFEVKADEFGGFDVVQNQPT